MSAVDSRYGAYYGWTTSRRRGDSVIDRRTFIGTLAGGILASPFITFAQQPAKLPRIGILGSEVGAHWEGFRQGMRDLGYVDGRNVTVEARWFEGRTDRLPALALELVQLNVNIIVAAGTQAIRAAKEATNTIPIVMALSAYPDKIGLVESLARPGGNVTGLSNASPDLMGKRFQLLKGSLRRSPVWPCCGIRRARSSQMVSEKRWRRRLSLASWSSRLRCAPQTTMPRPSRP